jgi:hypothetical protein
MLLLIPTLPPNYCSFSLSGPCEDIPEPILCVRLLRQPLWPAVGIGNQLDYTIDTIHLTNRCGNSRRLDVRSAEVVGISQTKTLECTTSGRRDGR